MTDRFAHMTPELWALWPVTVGLAAGALLLSAGQLFGAQVNPGSATVTALAAVMIVVLWVFLLWNRRRRSQWENQV